ncbi:tRNA 2-selenouridine(34) synthase MnmH [Synechococcus sp. MIT S9504]|uniref:tRNA 2-selenouridine(34) synthase MnmH n=1 Tax=Synechococcus sp. MIT S9504 TaxID=1801628 RepID=UPI0008308217|nr:tRNA 2-selenouridine(34) synthase MnmH [Synechococcus sp. MIT S9504]
MSGMGNSIVTGLNCFRMATGTIVDVRTPTEFAQGHWPGAVNIPLFSDDQRHQVGLSYKQQGRLEAIQLGLKLCGPSLETLSVALTTAAGGPTKPLRIYCWRGGMRSNSMGWLAGLSDHPVSVLDGGYKSYRRWVLDRFDQTWPLRVLGGKTGTGKTDLLLELNRQGVGVIDLEGLASHRGSSFGNLGLPPQPTSEHYENKLAECLETLRLKGIQEIWLEAESIQVGRCRIPKGLFDQMQTSPVLEIQRSDQERVQRLVEVYSCHEQAELRQATERIQKRLGPQRTREAIEAIDSQNWDAACEAMLDYYDSCYDRELERSPTRSSVNLHGLDSKQAAKLLLDKGHIIPGISN